MKKLLDLKNKKGFTLVELIVVIVIIAILAAVAVPMLTKYIGEAKASQKIHAVEVVSMAAQVAATEASRTSLNNANAAYNAFDAAIKKILDENKYDIDDSNTIDGKIICKVKIQGDTDKAIDITLEYDTNNKSINVTDVEANASWA